MAGEQIGVAATRRNRRGEMPVCGSFFRLDRRRRQLQHLEDRSRLRAGDDEPESQRPHTFEDSGHVALRILAIGQRIGFVAERQRAEEDHPPNVRILEQIAAGPIGSGLLGQRNRIVGGADVTEEGLIDSELSRPPVTRSEPDPAAHIIARRRCRPRQGCIRLQKRAFRRYLSLEAGASGACQSLRPDPRQPIDPRDILGRCS